jgi:hypothetical protein
MPQEELTPVIKLKPEALPILVAALCAQTGATPPAEPFTGPQLKVLIARSLKATIRKYKQEQPPAEQAGIE